MKRVSKRSRAHAATSVNGFLDAVCSANTRAAYKSDLAHFRKAGGSVPTTSKAIARYLARHAHTLAYATLCRRLSAIHKAHLSKGYASPVRNDLVRETLKGIRRTLRPRQRQVRPVLKRHLVAITKHFYGVRGDRDRAILLIGFYGALRRSELARLTVEDVETQPKGLLIHVRYGKTDQEGVGRDVFIPVSGTRLCAVRALKKWLRLSQIRSGALFRRVTAQSTVGAAAITGHTVALIVKRYVTLIGLDSSDYSGHSLRAGLVTAAAAAGAATWQIKQQTGHKTDAMVARYIRQAELVSSNVARLVI